MLKDNFDVGGSPMIFDDWRQADLIDNQGGTIADVFVNYDALKEIMICKMNDGKYLQLNNYMYPEINLSDLTLVNLNAYGMSGYGSAIYNGERIKCFSKTVASKSTSASSANAYNQVQDHYKITKRDKTFLWVDGKAHEIKRKDKDIDKLFTNVDVKKIVKSEKLKLKEDRDLVSLLHIIENKLTD